MNENNMSNVTKLPVSNVHALQPRQPVIEKNWSGSLLLELQKSLDPVEVTVVFADHIQKSFHIDCIEYRLTDHALSHKRGETGRSKILYRLSLEDLDLGEIIFSRKEKFSEFEISQIEDRLAILVYPLRNAVQYMNAVRSANKDSLTGLNNRLVMEMALKREIDLAYRHDDDFALLIADMDEFKKINDTYGHVAGDAALVHLADIFSTNVRNTDLLFRFAGDEFVIGLCKTDIFGAELLANRLLDAVSEAPFEINGKHIPLKLSLGGAVIKGKDTPESLFKRADRALYDAKDQGGHVVSFAEFVE